MKSISLNSGWRSGLILVFGAVVLGCCWKFGSAKTNPVAGVVVWLPEELLGYSTETGVMGVEEKRWLPDDTTFLKRDYRENWLPERDADYRTLSATLIVAGSDSRSLHRPRVCLTAQHWTIKKREVVELETKGGPLEVMDYHLVRGVARTDGSPLLDAKGEPVLTRAHYIYWWIGPGSSTASDKMRVWLEVWSSILKGRKERWAYPSVMVRVDERRGSEEAQERAYDFVREYAPSFQKSLGATEREGAMKLKGVKQN